MAKTKDFEVNINLNKNFVKCLDSLFDKYGEEMRSLNGFQDKQVNYSEFIDKFVDTKTVADASIDGNANVSTKDICSLTQEMSKPHMKLLSFNKIYHEIEKKYGKDCADAWLTSEYTGDFYMHDQASASTLPYCFAYDIEQLVNKGLFFIDGFNNQAPQHLTTYTDFVGEFVSWTSNRQSGACGLPSFLIYSYHFWKKDCDSGYFIKSPEYYRDQEFQRIIYKLNQPYLRVNQSAFTNFSIFDRNYIMSLFGPKTYPDGQPIINFVEEIIEYQKSFMEVVSKIRSENMMTFPVLSFCLLKKDGKFIDEEFAMWACKHNMKWADSNFFVSDDITSLSNCCRLVSDIKNLGYFNSIGGSALEVGSVKVNTINLARIAYMQNSKDEYLDILKEKVKLCCKALDSQRHIIKRNIEKGMLPNYSKEIMKLSSQYSTIGIVALYEAVDKFGLCEKDQFGYAKYTEDGLSFAKNILKCITETKNDFQEDKDYSINIEQIPAERAAAVLMEKDKILFPNEKYELPLYGNQWIPLGVKTTLNEKIRVSAELDKACSGGSISHINLDAPIENFDTAWSLLNYISDNGVTYFAFCTRISACENNHGFYGEICPHCGKPKKTTYQRIVGFLTPESSYSKERKAEFKMRDWFEIQKLQEI